MYQISRLSPELHSGVIEHQDLLIGIAQLRHGLGAVLAHTHIVPVSGAGDHKHVAAAGGNGGDGSDDGGKGDGGEPGGGSGGGEAPDPAA